MEYTQKSINEQTDMPAGPQTPEPKRPSVPPDIPFEIPVPPPGTDSLPVIRSWNRFCHSGSVDDYLNFKSIEGGSGFASQNSWNRFGADAVWFPGQTSDPAHF